MLSFLKPYIPKPLHPPSICTHDFLYIIHPLIFKLCRALQAKLHENMRHTDPPSTLPSRCESLSPHPFWFFCICYIDLMIVITSATSTLPEPECGKNQVKGNYVLSLLWLCTDIIEMNGSQHQGHCKNALHGRAYPTFLFHGCVMTSPPLHSWT
jgi:hypothetical protein